MEKKDYYVYAHLTPDDKKIFYIGVGRNHRVIEGGRLRNIHWQKLVYEKSGFLFEFLHKDLYKKQALKLEREYIKNIGLENLTNVVGENGNSTAFKKGGTPWNKGIKMSHIYNTKKIKYNNVIFNSVEEAIRNIGIGKTTFYRWVKKGKVEYV